MNDAAPDFYMSSSEDHRLNQLRSCYRVKRFHVDRRDDYLLIRISPSLGGSSFGVPEAPINELVIASRHKGISLFSISKWPVAVYVLRVLIENPSERNMLSDEELTLIGWAEIYDSPIKID